MLEETGQDRRRFSRQSVVRPCTIVDRRNLRPAATGNTTDLSEGGSLVCVQRERMFAPGDLVEVGIAWGRSPIIASDKLVQARVIRVLPVDHHHQALALEFEQQIEMTGSKVTREALAA
ncbi:MAG: PilZ domain-containing protein [Phycisphaerales bacterium]|nr:PilZ domain-containing protein [Phycisphaerales bacterium]